MEQIFKPFLRLRSSKAKLVQEFYASFDRSLIESYLGAIQAGKKTAILGEGRHFKSFKLSKPDRLSLALNLAKPNFFGSEPSRRQRWLRDLQSLITIDHPLVPPMEVLTLAGTFVCFQPFCEGPWDKPKDIQGLWQDLEQNLARVGLYLDDYPNFRECQGHPFLIDYSELKSCPGSGFNL